MRKIALTLLAVLALANPLDIRATTATVSFASTTLSTITDKTTGTKPFSGISVTNTDVNVDFDPVVIAFPLDHGTFAHPGGGYTFGITNGAYELFKNNMSASDAQTVLRTLVFTPEENRIPMGTVETNVFTITVKDASNSTDNATVSLPVTPANDAPILTLPPSVSGITDKQTNFPFVAISITDVDSNDTVSVGVSFPDVRGSLATNVNFVKTVSGPTATYTLSSSSPQSAETFLKTVVFTPTQNRILIGSTESTIFTAAVTDAAAATDSGTVSVTVTPVNDAPLFSGSVRSPINDNAATNLFPGFTITDVDNSTTQRVVVTASIGGGGESGVGTFTNISSLSVSYTNTPINASAWLQALLFVPVPNRQPVGSNEMVTVSVDVLDMGGVASPSNSSYTVYVVSMNDAPEITPIVTMPNITDNANVQPFDGVVEDADRFDTFFNVSVAFTNPADAAIGSFSPTNAFSGDEGFVETSIRGLTFVPVRNSVAGTKVLTFRFNVTDAHGAVGTALASLTIQGQNDPPDITGVTPGWIRTTDDPNEPPIYPFSTIQISDPDGGQILTVALTLDDSAKGQYSQTSLTGTAASVTAALRLISFRALQRSNRVVGETVNALLTIRVTDSQGASRDNSGTTVAITSVNGAPRIMGVPVTQPVLIPPAPPVRPFAGLFILDDETNNVTVSVLLDDPAKGVLTNLGGFVATVPGVYQIITNHAAASVALSNLAFVISESYVFPPNAPGGTLFTIRALDSVLNLASKTVSIILQYQPRNMLVTRTGDDNLAGSLRYAVANCENNGFITFALPEYPAQIRLNQSLGPIILMHNANFRGPGADQLTISGDSNGDGHPDAQLFRIRAVVTMEGLTLTKGLSAESGGAIYVGSGGKLTLRHCAVTESQALLYGGGIDVDGGALVMENCLVRSNSTSQTLGLGGGGISIFTEQACSIINSTFSGNRQQSVSGYAGGAIYAENPSPSKALRITVRHCTFAANLDMTEEASSLMALGFGTVIYVGNSVFMDGQQRNLGVKFLGEILSVGGNLSDDSTRTVFIQGGIPQEVILLNSTNDLTEVAAGSVLESTLASDLRPTAAYRLKAGSPAIGRALIPLAAVDQQGVLRDAAPDAGASEYQATRQVVLNEIQFDAGGGQANWLEFYVPRHSAPMDFGGLLLCVNGVTNHIFSSPLVVQPGHGLLVSETNGTVILSPTNNPIRVLTPSLLPLNLGSEGLIELRHPSLSGTPVQKVSYLGVFADPSSPTQTLAIAGNSISLAPQYSGAAYVPHSLILPPPYGGVAMTRSTTINKASPGSDASPMAFGSRNAMPQAEADRVVVGEDEFSILTVLANDLDADGLDQLVVIDISPVVSAPADRAETNSLMGAGISIDPSTIMDVGAIPLLRGTAVFYDPRTAFAIQSLPEGAELTDSFSYSLVDIGYGLIMAYSNGGASVVLDSPGHRLTNTEEIVISGCSLTNYNGIWAITKVSDDAFSIPVPSAGHPATNGFWMTRNQRQESAVSQATVTIEVLGANDAPVPGADFVAADEDTVLRVMADAALAGTTSMVFLTDSDYPVRPVVSTVSLLTNDEDVDTDDDAGTLKLIGVLSQAQGLLNYTGAVSAVSSMGAAVRLEIWEDRTHTSIIYDPTHAALLNQLAVGETGTDTFYYAVSDQHGAVSIGKVTMLVAGRNDRPVAHPDPAPLTTFAGWPGGSSLPDLLPQLEVMFALPAASGNPQQSDVRVRLGTNGTPWVAALQGLWITDEDTPIGLAAPELLGNDSDVDVSDELIVDSVPAASYEGAQLGLVSNGVLVVYDPTTSSILNSLARNEYRIDSFNTVISDQNGGMVTSLVAVLVIGRDDSPQAFDDAASVRENQQLVLGPTNGVLINDVERDINGVLPDNRRVLLDRIHSPTLIPNVWVMISNNTVWYDPSQSLFLEGLADGITYPDQFDYTLTDGSFLFANQDYFIVQAGISNVVLDVLSNDRNFTGSGGALVVSAVNSPSEGGQCLIGNGGSHLVYIPPPAFVGEEVVTYLIADGFGNTDRAQIRIRVTVNQINGILQANHDFFSVAKGESVILNVLGNDNVLPATGATLLLSRVSVAPSQGGHAVLSGSNILYAADPHYAGVYPYVEQFSYVASGGGSAQATGLVEILIVNREGALEVRDDAFSVEAGSLGAPLNVLLNDDILPGLPVLLTVKSVGPAVNGQVTLDGDERGVTYVPGAGFIGVDSFPYVATDKLGGTGTGVVTVSVGLLTPCNDIFVVTNLSPVVELDVLENDRLLQEAFGANLRISAVTPTNTAMGPVAIKAGGTQLLFGPVSQVGQHTCTYIVSDGGGRTASASVTILVVSNGIKANSDMYAVVRESVGNVLNVLRNDATIPSEGKSLAIVSIGTGSNAPNRGGTVSIAGDGLSLTYTPDPVYAGEETFTYTMTDSEQLDTAKVIVKVNRGELLANTDLYSVYLDHPEAGQMSRQFVLPVTANDEILPDLGQGLSIVSLGNGTNAPDHQGCVTIGADGQTLIYTPVHTNGNTGYTERFAYEISDESERRAQGVVYVRVLNRTNALNLACVNDEFAVAANSANNVLSVLGNDGIKPAGTEGWSISSVSTSGIFGGTVTIRGSALSYTAHPAFVGIDTFGYSVKDEFGGTGDALVTVRVGTTTTTPDYFTVLSGSESNRLEVMVNDPLLPGTLQHHYLAGAWGASAGGILAVESDAVLFTPDPAHTGPWPYEERFSYRVANNSGLMYTGRAAVAVYRLGADRSNAVMHILIVGSNDFPVISGAIAGTKCYLEGVRPFPQMTVSDVDNFANELQNVTVILDPATNGSLTTLAGFSHVSNGVYTLNSVTPIQVTTALQQLVFTPLVDPATGPGNGRVTRATVKTFDGHAEVADTNTTLVSQPLHVTPDPGSLQTLTNWPGGSLLSGLLSGLTPEYYNQPGSGSSEHLDVRVRLGTNGSPWSATLTNLWYTDEDSVLFINPAELVSNDIDPELMDQLTISNSADFSYLGGSVMLQSNLAVISYDPTPSTNLNSLARNELKLDSFEVVVSDGIGTSFTSLVAVVVVGCDDAPHANDDYFSVLENQNAVWGPTDGVLTNDVEKDVNGSLPDNRKLLLDLTNTYTQIPETWYSITNNTLFYNPAVSPFLERLAVGQSFPDWMDYTMVDGSYIFANHDFFTVFAGATSVVLEVLANDRNYTRLGGVMRISSVNATSEGGSCVIGSGATNLVYTPQPGFIGDEMVTYFIDDGLGNSDRAQVLIRVTVDRLNGVLQATRDHFSVARGTTAFLDVRGNDNVLPEQGTNLFVRGIAVHPDMGGHAVVSNNAVAYTPAPGYGGSYPYTEVFKCMISGGGASLATSLVEVLVVNRFGALIVHEDTFHVAADSVLNGLDVLGNDDLLPGLSVTTRIESVSGIAHGEVTLAEGGRLMWYTPHPGFVGREVLTYAVTDQVGGTGTATVTIVVGTLTACDDVVVVTNLSAQVEINVLANDLVQGQAFGSNVVISSVTPTHSVLGAVAVKLDGSGLLFGPVVQTGEQSCAYAITDGFDRYATGMVTLVVLEEGLYAAPDSYVVLKNSSSNRFAIMANDQTDLYLGKNLMLLGAGLGLEAPNRGGTVVAATHQGLLYYTPASGFSGVESFGYVLSDAFRVTTGRVSVVVSKGDLHANPDQYSVYMRQAPMEFVLPVLTNDVNIPGFGQSLSIVALGSGTNAPDHQGGLTIAPDGQSLRYTPVFTNGAISYQERFTYFVSNGVDSLVEGSVAVQVLSRTNAADPACSDDEFAVRRSSTSNVLSVLANDGHHPAGIPAWTITGVATSQIGATILAVGSHLVYTPPAAYVGLDTFSYGINDGYGATGDAVVVVRVGSLTLNPDYFTVISGSSSNGMDVLVNDPLIPGVVDNYHLLDVSLPSAGGTASVLSGKVFYAPDASASGPWPYLEEFYYRAMDDYGLIYTGKVQVGVFRLDADRSRATLHVAMVGVNDLPVISGTTSGQRYYLAGIKPFPGISIADIDNFEQELQIVTVAWDAPNHGALASLGAFNVISNGLIRLTGVTPAQATTALRQLVFLPSMPANGPGSGRVTRFTVSTFDGTVMVNDTNTTLIDSPGSEVKLVTGVTNSLLGTRVAASTNFVVAGIPGQVATNGLTYAAALIYANCSNSISGWAQAGKVAPTDNAATPVDDMSIAIDGDTLVVGHPRILLGGSMKGAAYVYHRHQGGSNNWGLVAQLSSSDGSSADNFGNHLAINGDLIIVGASRDKFFDLQSGSAYLFGRHHNGSNQWGQIKKFRLPNGNISDLYANSVAVFGDTLAIGAPNRDEAGVDSGAVYLYMRDVGGSNQWGLVATRYAVPSNAVSSQFGYAVDLRDNLLVVGSPKESLNGTNSGSVYLFSRDNGGATNWGQINRIRPPDAVPNQEFGTSLDLDSDWLAIGASGGFAQSVKTGSAYLYARNYSGMTAWAFVQKFTPSDGSTNNEYGCSVAVAPGVLAVGARKHSLPANSNGAIYIYDLAYNNAPATNVIPDQQAVVGRLFGYILPDNAFAEPDLVRCMSLRVSYNLSPSLGSWLTFDAQSRVFSGTPTLAGTNRVEVMAVDRHGLSATNSFMLIVTTNTAPLSQGTPMALWRILNFGAHAVGDTGLASIFWGDQADADGDGIPNLTEYLFGTNPRIADGADPSLLTLSPLSGSSQWVSITFKRRTGDWYLSYSLEASSDLISWTPVGVLLLSEDVSALSSDIELVTQHILIPTPAQTLQFYRLRVLVAE